MSYQKGLHFDCRRFSTVQCTVNNYNNNNFTAACKKQSLRRFSSIAAIDSKKLPPTVGPPPTASNGGGCFAATSAAAVSLLRCCREGDEAALQELMTGATGLQLQPSDVNCFDATGRVSAHAFSHISLSGFLLTGINSLFGL